VDSDPVVPLRILSLDIQNPGRLLPLPPARQKMVEFVGDSWTCGYGNLDEQTPSGNCTQGFAVLAAQHLDADFSLIALSGHGVVKNFGETPPSTSSMPIKYARCLPNDPASLRGYGRSADWGVVLLGENDFSSPPYPSEKSYVTALRTLFTEMRTRHPGIHILLAAPDRPHPASKLATQALHEEQSTGHDLQLLPLPNLDPSLPMGHLGHPGLAHHEIYAKLLVNALVKFFPPKKSLH
ncbi:MAG TPA: hypothetical protein VLM37_03800, partial [Fibrobacteraceae bacterium]|nr:hypothetical protein [Fibrobacteraceae bacterium]